MVNVAPFTMYHNETPFKVSFDREENKKTFLNVENVETGEVRNIAIGDYSAGSGNEHLLHELEGQAASGYVRQVFIQVFGYDPDGSLRGPVMMQPNIGAMANIIT